jgi:cytochrome d ubiquinol oxidase subunit II
VHLYVLPLLFVLAGLVLYSVLGGADFGAAWWELTAGRGREADRIREHAHESMAPVWEANHVWLIFCITVFWTAYPGAFGSIASTLAYALFVAGLGVILRGASYALRTGRADADQRHERVIDKVFEFSCVLTPFALGAAIGGIASGRVPYGNARGDPVTSWLNPTSIAIGVLAVATGAYLAAVYLSGDATRRGDTEAAERFRTRALASWIGAGAIAVAGLVVLHGDAHPLYARLVTGQGLPALLVNVAAALIALWLIVTRRYEWARFASAVAVAAIIAGWALAQEPFVLPGLTVQEAAAPHDTLVVVVVAVIAGAIILFPSLALLFRLMLTGRLGEQHGNGDEADTAAPAPLADRALTRRPARALRAAAALLVAGLVLMLAGDAESIRVAGSLLMIGFVAAAFWALVPLDPADMRA